MTGVGQTPTVQRGYPERQWSAEDLLRHVQPSVIPPAQLSKYLATFQTHGLVSSEEGGFRYRADVPELDTLVQELAKTYNEHPGTLVRSTYPLKDAKIQSFADASRSRRVRLPWRHLRVGLRRSLGRRICASRFSTAPLERALLPWPDDQQRRIVSRSCHVSGLTKPRIATMTSNAGILPTG
jgi:hypothetical protein